MWQTDSLWFEVAVVMTIAGVGSILLGHFEEHKPKWRRLLKIAIILGAVLTVSATLGRVWAFGLLALLLVVVLFLHAWWLPKHGVNGWTGEPRERYHELIGHRK
ncbi:MAG: hypothetical protein KAY32_05710 [Candidatus Eisenbacteria sp.]|nr:hypothetical protein [Candidatus Eisenbacteria bacterium]